MTYPTHDNYPTPQLTTPLSLYTANIVVSGKVVAVKRGSDISKLLLDCLYNLERPDFVDFYYNPTGKAVAGWGWRTQQLSVQPHGPKGYFESLSL